ncbi:P-loop containing nucleoside triphosphate hydrolase protein [Hygrophoropsis aurantiaca]|uniref:P-loop containing nucleoside triphosphate hydrolase protein n=1 Tax=Hygrophoropsis aurantiaca TaxID=72124 RepID=A0ACB8ASX3_9AGAM|nr:P-loop containing nucleoside triphosphate hydrolase protein [Hygrophoropsis aurantiaca]
MPRIRKKTSKRGTTNKRERIKHKVSESRKKVKKSARKDKAAGKLHKKTTKDPGIPNNFPYKDQILAEVAEQRRQAAEEKQRRKDEKRAAASAAAGIDVTDQEADGSDVDMLDEEGAANDGQGFDGVMSLRSTATSAPKSAPAPKAPQEPIIPTTPGPSTLRAVLAASDVVIHVVDARDPAACISEALLNEAKSKRVVIVMNKADTIPRESLTLWLAHLRSTYTTLPFKAASAFLPVVPNSAPSTKKGPVAKSDDALGSDTLWDHLRALSDKKSGKELVVAVTGVTNSGKSALINSLAKSSVMAVYNSLAAGAAKGPYTTTTAQEVVLEVPGSKGLNVKFVDTPGVAYVRKEGEEEREETRARDILLRNRGRVDRLKDPLFAVTHIVTRADTQDLMLAYSLPAFAKGDPNSFLAGMARVSGLVKKKGVLDHAGAARIVLKDWSTGRLARYTIPSNSTASNLSPSALAALYAQDEVIINTLRTRKEMRKGTEIKLVKILPGGSEKRAVVLDEEWTNESDESENESEKDGDEEDFGDDAMVDDDEDDNRSEVDQADGDESDEAEQGEEEAPPPPKRKRTVSFAVPPAGVRRNRGGPKPKSGRKGRK